jgi:hypothetical protein
MKKLLFFLSLLISLTSIGQVYNPSLHTVSNKAYGQAQAGPTDARSMFYDESNFVYRAYTDTAEVKSYLTLAKYRTGQFDIVVNTGGTLGLNGVITGGTNAIWFFRDGTANSDLIPKITPANTYTASGGITLSSLNFKLGGALIENTSWTSADATWRLNLTGINASTSAGLFTVTNNAAGYGIYSTGTTGMSIVGNATSGRGVFGQATSGIGVRGASTAGVGVYGIDASSGIGVFANSVSGDALFTTTQSGVAGYFTVTPTALNTVVPVIKIASTVQGLGATGSGAAADWYLRSDGGTQRRVGRMINVLTDATDATRTSAWELWGLNNAVEARKMKIAGSGKVTLDTYGAGTHTGTATKWAAFDVSGNLIEENAPSAFSNPMNAVGDIIVGTTAGALSKLAIGTTGQIPQVVGGTLAYATGAAWNGVYGTTTTTSSTSVTMDVANTFTAYTGSSPSTFTLPALSGNSNKVLIIKNNGSATVTVQRAGSDEIWTNTSVTSVAIPVGASRAFGSIGGYWTSYFEVADATNASNISSGTLADARLSANVPLLDAANSWSATNAFAGITATSITLGTVSNTEFSYLDGVSSAIQGQIDLKAPIASPTFTGTVVLPSTTSIGTVSSTEIGYVDGVTSAIQTQIDTKAPTISPTLTGTVVLPATTNIDGTAISKGYGRKAMEALGSSVKAVTVGTDAISNITTTTALVDGQRLFNAMWLNTPETITGIKFYQGTQGSFTGDNFNGIGLYSYSGGTLTQVAVTANDPNIWKGTSGTWQTVAFVSPVALNAGVYFYCMLYNNSAETTPPSYGVAQPWGASGIAVGDFTNSAKLTCNQTSQTTMPASIAMSSLSSFTTRPFAMLY